MIGRLRAALTDALGAEALAAAEARGRDLDRETAIARLDPAGFEPGEPAVAQVIPLAQARRR
ncbi:hypothetical protein GCM10025868_14070 [Angustibacter aerolatus]|uniref:Uncharacterized protein n=1 Tax=Angustibacter aerolatus TaxID=1162965 RepID=A0ABQ6JD91_9ACTN|nr:hypothetical protein [Angustibacter aerolatus]GMA86157.1 hypothetical protein GCM10025868_14070 [Angustibacter aerolatus]